MKCPVDGCNNPLMPPNKYCMRHALEKELEMNDHLRKEFVEGNLKLESHPLRSKTIHKYLAELRQFESQWKEENSGKHPVELAKALAEEVVRMAQEDGLQEVYVHAAQLNSGFPMEYGFAIAFLQEAKINVRRIDA